MQLHPIIQQSFAIIDQEIGDHSWSADEYAVVRRVIHSTADFEFKTLLKFSQSAIATSLAALRSGGPIVTDVRMVALGIQSLVDQTFQNPVLAAIEYAPVADPGLTRSETGLLRVFADYPQATYVIGNAPTALLALCQRIHSEPSQCPAMVIGAPVGFVSVLESKQALAETPCEQIIVTGRKGGSAVAAAIVNALLCLAWDSRGT